MLFNQEQLDPEVIAEAQAFADKWLPLDCIVMDLALLTTGEVKVIEFNAINSSGFYACDVKKIFKALWEYHTT
jgi:ATP-grasp domain, R2K clade family 3